MNARAPLLSVVVLNFNGKRFLDPLIDSLSAQTRQDFELILVDNASTDGSVAHLQEAHAGRFRVIVNAHNLGFAAGNNIALPHARGTLVAFLNNDTTVAPDWVERLLEAAERHPEAGSFACSVRAHDAPETMDTSGIIVYRDGMSRGLGRLEPASRYAEEMEVLAPSGCAAVYRHEVLAALGGFDPDFFAYCEDLDLGLRARLAGWTCWYVPTARVYHHYSGTTGAYSELKAFLVERNHLFVRFKLFPPRMLVLSPLYTLWRYALQAYGLVAGRGASGQFARALPAHRLLVVLVRAYAEAAWSLPALVRKRREAYRLARVEAREIETWFNRFGISARELALKD